MAGETIDYETFCGMTGEPLVAYIGDDWDTRPLSPGFLDALLRDMPTFDNYHLSYAISIGTMHDPARFLPLIPPYLADPRTSIWTAAHNAIHRQPTISPALYQSIKTHAKGAQADLSEWVDGLAAKVR